jgi:hypothetical protein
MLFNKLRMLIPDVVVLTNVTLEKEKWLHLFFASDAFLNVEIYLDGTNQDSLHVFELLNAFEFAYLRRITRCNAEERIHINRGYVLMRLRVILGLTSCNIVSQFVVHKLRLIACRFAHAIRNWL